MNNQAALRLTVNLLVIIIIASACLVFVTTFFLHGQEELGILTGIVEQQAKQQIMKELTQTTSKVVLPVFSTDLKRGETYTFGLGLRNYMGGKEEFTVKIGFNSAVNTETKALVVPNVNTNKFFIPVLGPYELEDKDRKIVRIPIRVPEGTDKGVTYKFDVNVTCKTDNALCKPHYGYPHQIEIDIV